MPTGFPDPRLSDVQLAETLATAAGRLLAELRSEVDPADPAELRRRGDALAQEYLAAALARTRPDDSVLSEEAVDDPLRVTADRVWIVDPLDGTREFAEPGRTDWAVHVALWAGELRCGAVALPALRRTYVSGQQRLAARAPGPPRVVVSRTRAPQVAAELAARIGAVLQPLGSAGAKVVAVLTGQADAYVHAGGQFEWDSAAPVAVATAAGAHASRLDGRPLRYNQPDPSVPDLLVCRPELVGRLAVDG